MASAARRLLTTLLRQSDRHPPGVLDAVDLRTAPRPLVDFLISSRVLTERAPLMRIGSLAVDRTADTTWAVSLDGQEEDEPLDPDVLRQFDIDRCQVAEALRAHNGLGGPRVQELAERLVLLGEARGHGPAIAVVLAWTLSDRDLPERAVVLERLLSPQRIVLLTPSRRDLPLTRLADLAARGLRVQAAEDSLTVNGPAWFSLAMERLLGPGVGEPRLRLQCATQSVRLDTVETTYSERNFKLLLLFAERVLAGRPLVRNGDIERTLWAQPADKPLIRDAVRELRDALARGHADPARARGLIVAKKTTGYACLLKPEEVRIDP